MSFAATTESRLALSASTNVTCYHELVVGMEGLVVDLVSRYSAVTQVRSELESEGRLALCEAAQSFTGQCRFATYAGRRMVRAMVSYLRTQNGGTQYHARRQQDARRKREWLAEVIQDEPTQMGKAYVFGRSLAEIEQTSLVQLDEQSIAPEVEDGAEKRFQEKWLRLQRTDRTLLELAERLGTTVKGDFVKYTTSGVSLTQLAKTIGERRSIVERRLGNALGVLVSD